MIYLSRNVVFLRSWYVDEMWKSRKKGALICWAELSGVQKLWENFPSLVMTREKISTRKYSMISRDDKRKDFFQEIFKYYPDDTGKEFFRNIFKLQVQL